MNEMSESMRCFAIIVITTSAVMIVDFIVRTFLYEQAQDIASFLPLLIGSIALCVMGIMGGKRNKLQQSPSQPNTAGIRRVRVTGPIK